MSYQQDLNIVKELNKLTNRPIRTPSDYSKASFLLQKVSAEDLTAADLEKMVGLIDSMDCYILEIMASEYLGDRF